jgi:hypothetical protein
VGGTGSPLSGLASIPEYRFRVEFWAILGCVVLFGALIELVRRNRLKERYSFLWFITAGVLLTLALKRDWLEDFARIAGVYYPPTALFMLLVFFMLLILIHFSTVISRLLQDKQSLTQALGILESRVRKLEDERQDSVSPGGRTSSTSD